MFAVLVASAQTNGIMFPQLLSPTNSVLMTNAEFRTFSGKKIFFRNDAGYKSFTADDLNTNVLTALGTSAAKLNVQQAALDAANHRYKVDAAAAKVENDRIEKLNAKHDIAVQNFVTSWRVGHGGQSPTAEQIRLDGPKTPESQ